MGATGDRPRDFAPFQLPEGGTFEDRRCCHAKQPPEVLSATVGAVRWRRGVPDPDAMPAVGRNPDRRRSTPPVGDRVPADRRSPTAGLATPAEPLPAGTEARSALAQGDRRSTPGPTDGGGSARRQDPQRTQAHEQHQALLHLL